jgi:hypothetical protein
MKPKDPNAIAQLPIYGNMRPDIIRPIEKIVEIINEASTCCGMNKEDVDNLRKAFVSLVAAIRH